MVLLPKINIAIAARGVTLIEMAMGMMLMCIIAIAVSSLVRAGVEAQLNQRMMNLGQLVTMNVVDDIRLDLNTANTVNITGGGAQLNITDGKGIAVVYTYDNAAKTMTRNWGGFSKTYNANISPAMNLVCDMPCFNWNPTGGAGQAGAQQTIILGPPGVAGSGLSAQPATPVGNSIIDQNFNPPVFFRASQISFNVLSNRTFQ